MCKFEERNIVTCNSCLNCEYHYSLRGWDPTNECYRDFSYCMLGVSQEDIEYVVDLIENKIGYRRKKYTPRLIRIMMLDEEYPDLKYGSKRAVHGRDVCQFWEKSRLVTYRPSLPTPPKKKSKHKKK